MSIGTSFEQALMKAVRGAELGLDTLTMPEFTKLTDEVSFGKDRASAMIAAFLRCMRHSSAELLRNRFMKST